MYDNKKGGAIMNKTKMENQNIANILLHLRQKNNLSQEQLAKKIGVTRQAVSRWEMGISIPSINTLLLISEQFDIPVETMLKKQEDSSKNNRQTKTSKKLNLFVIFILIGIILLFILPFLGEWEQTKHMKLYKTAYENSYYYIFEYPLSILFILSLLFIGVGIYQIIKLKKGGL